MPDAESIVNRFNDAAPRHDCRPHLPSSPARRLDPGGCRRRRCRRVRAAKRSGGRARATRAYSLFATEPSVSRHQRRNKGICSAAASMTGGRRCRTSTKSKIRSGRIRTARPPSSFDSPGDPRPPAFFACLVVEASQQHRASVVQLTVLSLTSAKVDASSECGGRYDIGPAISGLLSPRACRS